MIIIQIKTACINEREGMVVMVVVVVVVVVFIPFLLPFFLTYHISLKTSPSLLSVVVQSSKSDCGMGRQPCCDKVGLKKGPWTAEEDRKLINFILTNGQCCWRAVPKLAGLPTFFLFLFIDFSLLFFGGRERGWSKSKQALLLIVCKKKKIEIQMIELQFHSIKRR